ncbi:MAG: hypothetical protein JXJ19_03730 [Elusimicrobia bacterium]|nr:hypothetical protein [Elusimicrobiota bacterium]
MKYLLKIGGNVRKIREIGRVCRKYSGKHGIVLMPGGWGFASLIRDYIGKIKISGITAQRMAVRALDMNALIIADILGCDITDSIGKISSARGMKVFAPARYLLSSFPFRVHDIDRLTSDYCAAYVAGRTGARLLYLKDVDGIFDKDPKKYADAVLYKDIGAPEISGKKTCIDETTPSLIQKSRIDCLVLNGNFPGRIDRVFSGNIPRSTKINIR